MDTNDDNDDADVRPGDLLLGADAIRLYLASLGLPKDVDIYYLRRSRAWPIGTTGGRLIASKRLLSRHAARLTRRGTIA